MTSRPELICVTGPDGAGKTTQVKRLAEHYGHHGGQSVHVVTIWDLLADPSARPQMPFESPAQVDAFLGILHPTSRAHFLFSCLHEALARALDKGVDVLLLNAYWYKYYATEVAHGANADEVLRIASAFPEPDRVFYLEVSPEEAFERKALLSAYETGFDPERGRDAFLAFQRTAHAALDELADRSGWTRISGASSPEEQTAEILGHIAR